MKTIKCQNCRGRGKVAKKYMLRDSPAMRTHDVPCGACAGTGAEEVKEVMPWMTEVPAPTGFVPCAAYADGYKNLSEDVLTLPTLED